MSKGCQKQASATLALLELNENKISTCTLESCFGRPNILQQLVLTQFNAQDLNSNSPYYPPYGSCYVSLENLVLDQLTITS